VVIAEEIATTAGEIMGLFLNADIRQGLSPRETISQIRNQGGLIAIPHPFGRSLSRHASVLTSTEILSQVDIIEAFNSRTPFSSSIARAGKLAKEQGKARSAGSDAHTLDEIGRAYVEMAEFDGPAEFLTSLAEGEIFGQRSSYLTHFASTWAKIRNHMFGPPPRNRL